MKTGNMPIFLEISRKMNSTVELSEILQLIVDLAKEYMGVKRVSVFLVENNKFVLKAFAGFTPSLPVVIAPGEGITGTVGKTGETKRVNNLSNQQDMGYTAKSYISLPIKTSNNIIGVLNLTDKFDDFFNEEDMGMAEYIAEQCSLAVERFNLYSRMRGAERMEAIGTLRAAVAHDIRNLLGIVQVYLSMMEDSATPELEEYIVAIRLEIDRVQGITGDIMEYSKQKIELRYEYFDINEICRTIAKQLGISLKFTDIKVLADVSGEFMIHADRQRLFRIIFNLANNAVQALNDERGVVCLRAKKYANKASISVFDNGKGITNELIATLFDPFVTSGKQSGTGLGLAIVQEVVTAHHGRVKVRSKLGEYTVFNIIIPIQRGA